MSTVGLSPARQKLWYISRLSEEEFTTELLLEGALAIAWEEYPRIDLAHYRSRLDRMAEDLSKRLEGVIYPMKIIQEVNRYLFEDQKFRGNDKDYYNPRNSFVTDVLDRRLGIPITLSVVYMALGDRIGFPCVGVSLPGHFIIRPQRSDIDVFIDPYANGEILFEEDCALRLAQVYGQAVQLRSEYLKPVGARKILERILMNLKLIYLQRGDLYKSLAAIERILMLCPNTPLQLRDRGLLCYQLERYIEARADLETYLESYPQAADAQIISKLLDELN